MISVDVNVLVYGFDRSGAHHERARALLEERRAAPELTLLFPVVLSGFLRVVTDRRILKEPADPGEALGFVDAVISGPSVAVAEPGIQQWAIFRELVGRYRPRGPETTDLYLAAAAIEKGLTWYSFDRGFARFPGLRWINPADPD